MIQSIWEAISWGLGLDALQLTFWQMAARASIIYVAALGMVRIGGDRRFIAKHAALDVLLSIILGSTLSRAINGSAPFFPTIGAAIVLVALHWLFAAIAFHFSWFDRAIKGNSRPLVRDGEIRWKTMRESHITQKDLEESLRLTAKTDNLDQIRMARLESSGEISFLTEKEPPQILEMKVENGVKTVRIQLN